MNDIASSNRNYSQDLILKQSSGDDEPGSSLLHESLLTKMPRLKYKKGDKKYESLNEFLGNKNRFRLSRQRPFEVAKSQSKKRSTMSIKQLKNMNESSSIAIINDANVEDQ